MPGCRAREREMERERQRERDKGRDTVSPPGCSEGARCRAKKLACYREPKAVTPSGTQRSSGVGPQPSPTPAAPQAAGIAAAGQLTVR